MKRLIITLTFVLVLASNIISGTMPPFMNYQGRLTGNDGSPIPDGTYDMIFAIYDSFEGGTELWNSGTMPVNVEDGLFTVQLGILGSSLFTFGPEKYLGIKVGGDPEMTPRTPFLMVPYAAYSAEAETAISVKTGSIYDVAINTNANIDRAKILGNAAVTSIYSNTFSNDNTFDNNVHFKDAANAEAKTKFYDSTMVIDNVGIRIGNFTDPTNFSPLAIERHYNVASPNSRYGLQNSVVNASTGMLCANWNKAQRTSASSTDKYTYGVYGYGAHDNAVGHAVGVFGYASGAYWDYAIYGSVSGTSAGGNYAGYFIGDVGIQGEIVYLLGGYKIDNPTDPENMYLYHNTVSSPDMKNIYDGNVVTDSKGQAIVELPDYFEDLNADYRYQLTVIGSFAQAIVEQEISGNKFVIATDEPNVKVSWMVTGIRKDPLAQDRARPVEQIKNADEIGNFVYPAGYGYGEDRSVNYDNIQQAQELAKGVGED